MTEEGHRQSGRSAEARSARELTSQNWLSHVELKASDFLIALPVIHLVLTISHLFTYGIVYGGGLRKLLSASDVVNAAIQQMPLIYAIIIIIPLLVFAFPNYPQNKSYPKDKLWRNSLIVMGVITLLTLALLIVGIVKSQDGFGSPFDPYFALPFWLSTNVFLSTAICSRFKLTPRISLEISILSLALAVAVFFGGQAAQSDKYARFGDPTHPRPICGDAEVLGTISDKLLVVRRDGSKALYTTDCKLNLTLPVPEWLTDKERRIPTKQTPS